MSARSLGTIVLGITLAGVLLAAPSAVARVDAFAPVPVICGPIVVSPFVDPEVGTGFVEPDGGGCIVDWGVEPPYAGPTFDSDVAAAAADPPPPPPVTPALPTWRNLYDWPNSHGYVGWHSATSSAALYGLQSDLGGNRGLWLWPTGGDYSTGAFAEWTYTAPGTTRLSRVDLNFEYRNKLLAHHCIVIGLRTGMTVISQREWCTPANSPDSQRGVALTLADPSPSPTSKVLFVRLRLDCKDQTSCTKHIPAHDPLTNGPDARVTRVDMTLVDDDLPTVWPSGPLVELSERYVAGVDAYDITLDAADAGSGIERTWLERVPGGESFGADAPCDATHRTEALDARRCPERFAPTGSVDTRVLPEGTTTFVARARDVARNVGSSSSWRIFVDRTGPTLATDIALLDYNQASQTATVGWTPGTDPPLPDGVAGSGVQRFEARWSRGGGAWSDWAQLDSPELEVTGVSLGDALAVEIRSADDVGNIGPSASANLTVFAATGMREYSNPDDDADTLRQLTATQTTRAGSLAQLDSRIRTLLGGRATTVQSMRPWTLPAGQTIGARLSLRWTTPVTLERDWPVVNSADDGSYSLAISHARVTDVTELLVAVDLVQDVVVAFEPSGPAIDAPQEGEDQVTTGSTFAAARSTGGTTVKAAALVLPYWWYRTPPTAPAPPGTNPEGSKTKATPANLRFLTSKLVSGIGNDRFWNWDFHHDTAPAYTKTARADVDWPVNLVFWNNADVPTAKDLWNRGGATFGGGYLFASAQFARLWDIGPHPAGHASPVGPVWDRDRGTYTGVVCTGHKWHYRVYAPGIERGGSDRMYNLAWGYYVIATSHQDHHDNWKEQCNGDWYGGSEDAEHKVAQAAPGHTALVLQSTPFATVLVKVDDPWRVEDANTAERKEDTLNLYNRDKRGWIWNRLYDSDGYASMIRVDHRGCELQQQEFGC